MKLREEKYKPKYLADALHRPSHATHVEQESAEPCNENSDELSAADHRLMQELRPGMLREQLLNRLIPERSCDRFR